MKRRIFIRWSLFGAIFAYLFSAKTFTLAEDDSYYEVGSLSQLKSEGILLNEDLEIGAVLVMLNQDDSMIAVDPTCTHAGCTVEWNKSDNNLICPCHQSKFQQDGTLIEGLAISDLPKYQVKVEQDSVFVAVVHEDM